MLSPKERELVNDAGLILTKNAIMQKVQVMFGEISEFYKTETQQYPALANSEALVLTPKIARGENYEGFPWVMLDYPRCFTKTDVFAIRTFFWWGHYCSITLQLAGKYQQQYGPVLANAEGWYVNSNTNDPWQHHFREDNYLLPQTMPDEEALLQLPFIKLAKKIPLTEWDNIVSFFEGNYAKMLRMLTASGAEAVE